MTIVAEEFLTPQQLASLLQVPVRTLYEWRYRGEGPPGFRLGRHLRYRRADIDSWVEDRVNTPNRQRR